MSDNSPSLPIISLATLLGRSGEAERAAEIIRLREVTHTIGFFYLADHGVPEELQQQLFDAARRFFALPKEAKQEISNLNNPHYRGYAELGDERTQGLVDWREQIDYGADRAAETGGLTTHPWRVLEGPNPWPTTVPELKDLVNQWLDTLTEVGLDLLRAWAESLGQEPDFFDGHFTRPYPLLKLAHYPGHDGSQSGQGVGAHHDPGVLTLLLPEQGSAGLQVENEGGWIDVEPLPNHFVVNIGELLEAATDGYLKATPHRVLPPGPGTSRYSIPYFLAPNLDSRFPRVPLPGELAAVAPGRGRDMHGEEIFDISGRNTLKARLRAHPETTARYHADLAASLA
ncbi:isopenicillin N synthase family oxygenase [Corynebacterium hylobatis]|uniref:Isopenicillin N synthase family oxygenase n=1 Tax=Corynebacterium hylobatis TaxID=1859290 RepID=A0A430I1V5_9CORY|nr:2-oxoglutarate and iron-dependent oxygenase domain-containing protein [Corynebacterium hylobatis]RSZ65621.1 isopenicillin N synthase family oxygenase [Corynebacterium hylobatis]